MTAWLLLAFLVIAGVLFFLRGDVQVLSTMDNTEIAILAAGVLLIAVYLLLILADERSRPLRAIRYLMTWAAFGLFLVTSYTYRQELSAVAYRVAGELLPAGQTMVVETEDKSERAVRVRKRFDGHFSVRASINGQAMLLLVDTGASTVVLKPADASRARRRYARSVVHRARADRERPRLCGAGASAFHRHRAARDPQCGCPRRAPRQR